MPELPEVETVRRGLAPFLEGVRIVRAEARRPDLRWPLPADLACRLTDVRVNALRRRSKYLLADLDSGETLLMHLGMSGRIVIGDARHRAALGRFRHEHPAPTLHDHVLLDLHNGVRITFNDPRRFGAMDLAPTASIDRHRLLSGLGPEPLGNQFSAPVLALALAGRRSTIKTLLLDQRIVAGLGNIYVCEALHRARISPRRTGGRIGAARIEALVTAIREVLVEAIAAGGSSLRDYRKADGELGYFQHAFRVYGREGARCERPGCDGSIRRVTQSGRSSFYCAGCQR